MPHRLRVSLASEVPDWRLTKNHCCGRRGRGSLSASACDNNPISRPYTDHRPPHARTNSPAHQIDLFRTAFAITLFELLPAPIE